ncbi:extracellular solute-binding protein [Natronospora cellulosivora (SeqCode)]
MPKSKLRIWIIISTINSDALEHLKKAFSLFKSKNSIEIQVEFVTWERVFTALVEDFKNGTGPDVIQLGTSWISTFAHMGYLDKVPEYIDVKSSINPGINNLCKYEGELHALPWLVDTIIMAGHKDYMSNLGISKSDVKDWRGFKKVLKNIIEHKKSNSNIPNPLSIAFNVDRDSMQRFFSILWSKGWEFPNIEKKGVEILTDPFVLDTISYFADLKMTCNIDQDWMKHPYQVNEDFYLHGLSLFYIGSWNGIVNSIKCKENKNQGPKEFCVLPFPSSDKKSSPYGGGSVLAVSSKSKEKTAAWSLVDFILSDEFISKWTYEMGNISAFKDEFWQKRVFDERIQLMYEQTVNSKVFPAHPAWITIEKQIIQGLGHAIVDLLKKRDSSINDKIYSNLKKTDLKVQEIVKMSWEAR